MHKSMILAAPLLLVASPASAQSVTGTVNIDGSVAARCLFAIPNATIHLNEIAQGGSGAGAGTLNTAAVNGQTATLDAWCNGSASTMAVETTALTLQSPPASIPSGFVSTVDYTADATASTATGTDSSLTPGAGTPVTVGLFNSPINVALKNAATAAGLLVAGTYTGNVKVTLTPSL
ncbi:MAG: hypothetical protein RIQ99_1544 [Pseudomonadota bacterium]|jgi:hypothetical protein